MGQLVENMFIKHLYRVMTTAEKQQGYQASYTPDTLWTH